MRKNRITLALGWIGFGFVSAIETLIFGPKWSTLTVNMLREKSDQALSKDTGKHSILYDPEDDEPYPRHWRN